MKRLELRKPVLAGVAMMIAMMAAELPGWAQSSPLAIRAGELVARATSIEPVRIQEVRTLRGAGVAGHLADSEVLFLIGDWESTALRLLPLVESPRLQQHAARPRARWLLAESLYQQKNYSLAEKYFEQASAELDPEYGRVSAVRLLEIALETHDFESVDQRFNELQSRYGAEGGPEISYLRGRALYRRGQYDRAQTAFLAVPEGHELHARARYHAAIAQARQGDLDGALQAMVELERQVERSLPMTEDWDVLQLSRLAQGRFHYEVERWNECVDAYARVSRDSRWFQAALYEISWTMIREERFEVAVNNLEVLSIIADNTRFIAEARILMGEMRRRADQLPEALTDFEAVAEDYGHMRDQLRTIASEPGSAAERFDAAETIDTGGVLAPFRMNDWVIEDGQVSRSLQIVRESDGVTSMLQRNEALANEIREVLSSQARYERVPEAQAHRNQLLLLLAESVELRLEAVNEERDRVAPGLSEEQQAEYAALAAERLAAERRFRSAPRTEEGLLDGTSEVRAEMESVIIDYYRTELQLEQQLEDLEHTEAMLRQQVRAGSVTGERVQVRQEELRTEREQLQVQLDETRRTRQSLERERVRMGIGEMRGRSERAVQELLELLRREHAWLLTASGQSEIVSGHDAVYRDLDGVVARVASLVQHADQEVDRALGSLRERLEREEQALQVLSTRQDRQRAAGIAAADDIAMGGFRRVLTAVEEVALRADVGVIDVAWWEKERLSTRISSLFREKDRQLRVLDADFAEIRDQEDHAD